MCISSELWNPLCIYIQLPFLYLSRSQTITLDLASITLQRIFTPKKSKITSMKFTQLGNLVILAAIVHGQVTSERLVGDINAITDLSSQTDDLTQSISITNFFSTAPASLLCTSILI